MKKYLHLGFPKNFSTSLQRNYFSEHKDIFHLGIGLGSSVNYIDLTVSSIFEVYLKTAKEFKYREEKNRLKDHISALHSQALSEGKKCFGASSEHLSFAFTHEILDFKTKIERSIELFGKEDLNMILIVRNQVDLLKSLYRESVRVGLPYDFKEYLNNLYKFQDRNYVYDFRYDLVYDCLRNYLPSENIHILFFESFRGEDSKMVESNGRVTLVEQISKILEIDYLDVDFQHFNAALTSKEIVLKSKMNYQNRHDLGRELTFSAEIHRQVDYFKNDLDINEEEHVTYADVLTKRRLIAEVKEKAKGGVNTDSLYNFDQTTVSWFEEFFNNSNIEFSKKANLDLPDNYYRMKF